jgi:hypothetical protein
MTNSSRGWWRGGGTGTPRCRWWAVSFAAAARDRLAALQMLQDIWERVTHEGVAAVSPEEFRLYLGVPPATITSSATPGKAGAGRHQAPVVSCGGHAGGRTTTPGWLHVAHALVGGTVQAAVP